MKNKLDSDNYIEEIIEWQEKQYLPGAYLGGNFPPFFRSDNRPLGYVFFILGVLGSIGIFFSVVSQGPILWENIFSSFAPFIITLLMITTGIRILRKTKKHK